ncbi:MFS transporter [Lacrimispora sp.]|jgi:MFS family permease|uniref:MFS transporter n=1 Tax=Lacrimispora sp. TaxID=2719234 RepID=UPI0028AE8DFE|nr:MFS transporter [Lacrimispora sp.]
MKYEKLAVPVILASLPGVVFEGLFPLYTTQLGFTTLKMTIFYSTFALSGLIMRLLMGTVSDRYTRRSVFLWALSLYAVAYFFLSGAESMTFLMVARFVQGAAGILLTLSVIGVITDENNNFGQSMGRFDSNRYLGGIIGIGLSFLIFYHYDLLEGWKLFFLCCAVASLVGCIYSFFRIKRQEKKEFHGKARIVFSRDKKKIWVISLVFNLFSSMIGVLVIPYLKAAYDLNMETMVFVFMLPILVSSFVGPHLGRLGDSFGYRKVMVISAFLSALMAFSIPMFHNIKVFSLIWTFYVVFMSALDYALDALFVQGIKENEIGNYYGKYAFGVNIGGILGPVAGGYLFDKLGIHIPYMTFSVLMVLFGLFVLWQLPRESNEED